MKTLRIALGLWLMLGLVSAARGHPGATDEYGGHTDSQTGVYHVHKCMVVGDKKSKVYLVPGDQLYKQMATTSQDKACFNREAEAINAGYRKPTR